MLQIIKKKSKPGRRPIPLDQKKISVSIYQTPIDINRLGGIEVVREKMYTYFQTLLDIENDAN